MVKRGSEKADEDAEHMDLASSYLTFVLGQTGVRRKAVPGREIATGVRDGWRRYPMCWVFYVGGVVWDGKQATWMWKGKCVVGNAGDVRGRRGGGAGQIGPIGPIGANADWSESPYMAAVGVCLFADRNTLRGERLFYHSLLTLLTPPPAPSSRTRPPALYDLPRFCTTFAICFLSFCSHLSFHTSTLFNHCIVAPSTSPHRSRPVAPSDRRPRP